MQELATPPSDQIGLIYWVITALLVPTVVYLFAQWKTTTKEKEKAVSDLQEARIADMRTQIAQYHDALKVVESSFDLASKQSAGFDTFKERMSAFIAKSENFQERVLGVLTER